MTAELHVAELQRRHQMLEREIEEATLHPGTDSLTLAELKRRKLHLKDEISRLKAEPVH